MTHPYSNLAPQQYWRSASHAWKTGNLLQLYRPKFAVTRDTRIGSGGSCFAQHIARNLRQRGYNFRDFEPAPTGFPAERAAEFGYGLYSARYGNIYSSRQLLHIVQAACGSRTIDEVWESDGRWYDPTRPNVEPGGFESPEEVRALRGGHHAAVRRMMEGVDVFVFTMGLTETWVNRDTGLAYPTCPGTVAGRYDATRHAFVNLGYKDVRYEMEFILESWRNINPDVRFLLTVSPVPLAATAEERHIVAATCFSKAVLRAVAGDLAAAHDFVDYFPSYEIVTSHLNTEASYLQNNRDIRPETVERVMGCFFAAHGRDASAPSVAASAMPLAHDEEAMAAMDVLCEEARLDVGPIR